MQAAVVPIILTRTQEQSCAFAVALRAACELPIDIRIQPLLKIQYLRFDLPHQPKHLIFTSPHGVSAWVKQIDWRVPAIVVGEQTAQCAKTNGFELHAQYPTVACLKRDHMAQGACYIRGQQISQPLDVDQRIAYRQIALPWSGPGLANGGAIFPLFSKQSAVRLLNAGLALNAINAIAISHDCAQPLIDAGLTAQIAATPDRHGMIKTIIETLGNF